MDVLIDGLRPGLGFYSFETHLDERFRWFRSGALIHVIDRHIRTFSMDIEVGPCASAEKITVRIVDARQVTIFGETLTGRRTLHMPAPVGDEGQILQLLIDGAGRPLTGDSRSLDARVFATRPTR